MVLTQVTLALSITIASAVLSILIGAFGRRSFSRNTIVSVIVFCIAVPLTMFFVYTYLEPYVTIHDWPLESGSFLSLWNPATAIFLVSGISGFLGMFAGKYWGEDEDRSCLQCLLGPIIVLFVLSIGILVLL
jgi:predicted MFS family arabinose efflux permease